MSAAVRVKQWLRLFRTTVFRLALAYALAYSMLTGLVLGGVYLISSHFLQQQVDTELLDARDVLRGLLHDEGKSKRDLHELLGRPRSRLPGARLFLLMDKHRHVIAGSMPGWPKGLPLDEGFVTFSSMSGSYALARMHDADDSRMRGLVTHLRDGGWLLIAQPLGEADTFADTILGLLMLALAVISVLGVAGGALMGRGVLARIDAVRETAAEIMAGGLDQRIPVAGRRDEFVELAEHLNAMLARIEALIHGMRAVTDNVAHDLRSPLNRLRSHLEVALLESRSADEYRQVLEEAVDELEGVVRTFNALLSIAQAESGVRREHLADVDLSALASDLAELYEAPAEDAGLSLLAELSPGVRVRGQRELLAQALSNLLDNAVKYSPAGGRIVLSLAHEGRIARLQVCDSGPGIPAESREKVLERFARLDDARSTPGNGLGLALVKAVAQVHDAELELSDAEPGLCVELRFPVIEI
ncbi:MAG: ATP-binding protein [Acidihalobacter sp.]|jgi:signal transduction histidine kinase